MRLRRLWLLCEGCCSSNISHKERIVYGVRCDGCCSSNISHTERIVYGVRCDGYCSSNISHIERIVYGVRCDGYCSSNISHTERIVYGVRCDGYCSSNISHTERIVYGVRCDGCCSSNIPHTEHIVYPAATRTSSLVQCWSIHRIAVTTVLRYWRWANDCPKHVELIQRSIKLLLLHLVGHLYYSPILMMHCQTQIKTS